MCVVRFWCVVDGEKSFRFAGIEMRTKFSSHNTKRHRDNNKNNNNKHQHTLINTLSGTDSETTTVGGGCEGFRTAVGCL